MSFGKKLLSAGGLAICVLALAVIASAASENPSVLDRKERQLNGQIMPLGETPTVSISLGDGSPAAQRLTFCNGDSMGTPKYALNSWFTGTEYYATYQDPTETGCPLPTYPFQIDTIKWHVYNPADTALNLSMQGVVWAVDAATPSCLIPGEVLCYSPMFSVTLPAGPGGVIISLPMNCCVYGPYFAGVYCPDFTGTGFLGIVTDSSGFGGTYGASRTCANYNNYRGFHEDLIVAYPFLGNLRLWTVGSASDMNTCDPCDYVLEPGVDLWTSPPGVSFDNHFTASPIPADFFGPGSDPFDGSVCLAGSPLTTNPPGILGTTDCIIRRNLSLPLSGVPAMGAVPIEIVALNLVSCQPITVTYNSGPPQQWNVQVTLSSNVPQQQGQMTVRKECCNGGTFDSQLPVLPKFIFSEVGNPTNQRVLDLGGMMPPIQFQSTGSHWSHDVPLPFDMENCPGLVACDNDLSNLTPNILIDPSSRFTPGMRTLPCNPGSPNDPFCVGKSLTLEEEMLARHGVLPPQETTPLEGACCLPDSSCIITDPSCCAILGGAYQGDFTSCTPFTCAPVDSVYDSLCTEAEITVTISPTDNNCTNPIPPVILNMVPGSPTIIRRSPSGPYVPGQIIETEIIQMNLTGTSPVVGPVIFRQSPTRPSLGQSEVLSTDPFGNPLMLESFFDVFYEVELPMPMRTMMNQNPTRMQATPDSVPPSPGTTFTRVPGPPDLLLDVPGGFPVGYLCDAIHTIVACECCVGLRGSPNGDATEANILDLNYAVNRIFRGGPPALCFEEGNPNGDGSSLNILDLNYFVNRIFRGGPLPVPCPR